MRCALLTVTVATLLLLGGGHAHADAGKVKDYIERGRDAFTSGGDIVGGIVSQTPDLLRAANGLMAKSGQEALLGMPYEAATAAINEVCSIALSAGAVRPRVLPSADKLNYVLMTTSGNYSLPTSNSGALWTHPAFDHQLDTVILVTGWLSDQGKPNEAIERMWAAYKCRGDANFIVFDTARFVDSIYTWSALNTEALGESLAEALYDLVTFVPLERIHLIGHSLGAQIVGAAGRWFQQTSTTGESLPRITGLDPARPCFKEGELLTGLFRGDADFVDVIHTNGDVLGQRQPIGDVDFYVNGVSSVQPGCFSVVCSHQRAWEYFAESVYAGGEQSFMATRCSSMTALWAGRCNGDRYPMGYGAPRFLKGNYFLETNARAPYGRDGDAATMRAARCAGMQMSVE